MSATTPASWPALGISPAVTPVPGSAATPVR